MNWLHTNIFTEKVSDTNEYKMCLYILIKSTVYVYSNAAETKTRDDVIGEIYRISVVSS